jgi:predicted MFS family arabinose efflux permease
VFVLRPPFAVAVLAAGAASYGYSACLPLQERLVAITPDDIRGQALGLHSAGTQTMQAVGAALTGAAAQWLAVPVTMTVAAAASVAVTLALTPGLRQPAAQPGAEGQRPPAPSRSADPVSG